jgi:hypothetical protein
MRTIGAQRKALGTHVDRERSTSERVLVYVRRTRPFTPTLNDIHQMFRSHRAALRSTAHRDVARALGARCLRAAAGPGPVDASLDSRHA